MDLLIIHSQIEMGKQIMQWVSMVRYSDKEISKRFWEHSLLLIYPCRKEKKKKKGELKWSPNASPFIIHAERWHFLRILIKIMMNTCVGILWQDSIIHHNLLSTLRKKKHHQNQQNHDGTNLLPLFALSFTSQAHTPTIRSLKTAAKARVGRF